MWRVTLRDLQWRRRRYVVSVAGTSLVFAMTLLLAGLGASFGAEVDNTLHAIGGDTWAVQAGSPGPFSNPALLPDEAVQRVARARGISHADPVVIGYQPIHTGVSSLSANIIGIQPSGITQLHVNRGRQPMSVGEAAVNASLNLHLGQSFTSGKQRLRTVGILENSTFNAGTPNVFVTTHQAQDLALGGQPLISAVIASGVPHSRVPGLEFLSIAQVRTDLLKPFQKGSQSIDFVELLLWLVATAIVGSIIYLSALERLRDFAVLKATGTSNADLTVSLVLQALFISLVAAAVGAVAASLLSPLFPLSVETPGSAFALLPAVAVVIAILASVAGLRRAVGVQPALAFGGP